MIRYSLVVPAYNEARYLPRLLDTVPADPAIEVVVADNASTDATAAVAVARGCRVVRVERRMISAARNGGAAAARGEVLCFVDADSRLHPDTFTVIERTMADPRVVGGGTGITFERWSPGTTATYLWFQLSFALSRLAIGVVFCRRADFLLAGGFDERRHFSEDVEFLLRLRRLGRRRGQRFARPRGAPTVYSTRKFDLHGDWHCFPLYFRLAYYALFRPYVGPPAARRYWYRER